MTVPAEWILASLVSLAGVISALAGLLWSFMKARIEKQDVIISHLQEEVSRLSKGCGFAGCAWFRR